jgi:aminoglycoside phosphotransferase (APT) family kinase protein
MGLREWAEGMLAGAAGRRLGDLGETIARLWAREESRMRDAAAPVLVHSDFKPANVKWLPKLADVLVLDWEFAWSGPPLMDIGQFLRWGAPEPFVAALASAYCEAGGELPEGWRRTGELLDLFNLVGMLDQDGERPIRQADLRQRIESTLRREP